jgi:hypothetical protein
MIILPVCKDPKDPKEIKETREIAVIRVCQAQPDRLDHKEFRDRAELPGKLISVLTIFPC